MFLQDSVADLLRWGRCATAHYSLEYSVSDVSGLRARSVARRIGYGPRRGQRMYSTNNAVTACELASRYEDLCQITTAYGATATHTSRQMTVLIFSSLPNVNEIGYARINGSAAMLASRPMILRCEHALNIPASKQDVESRSGSKGDEPQAVTLDTRSTRHCYIPSISENNARLQRLQLSSVQTSPEETAP